ncbi:P-loop containing nucleoside triphosphate hydrolase protein [Crassisporium funariophilum]|nr:P-loop containing nucleoside triphosphate hydrolase protein [Crassisporium funariophilum]
MPPRRGIVKSGNAGNSSKPGKPTPQIQDVNDSSSTTKKTEPPPLFPPGSKFPLSLLNERCQKEGWERPVVDTRRRPDGWSFVVTLSRHNKKTSQMDKVVMEPHPPYCRPTAIEARHWGATYALYRFCNRIQLHLVLPPEPRAYWNELAEEHKKVPEHQNWMYEADPFLAQQGVQERQAKADKKRQEASTSNTQNAETTRKASSSSELSGSPEVRMASSLRELVEDAIKQGMSAYPDAADPSSSSLLQEDIPNLSRQLGHLGFNQAQIRDVTKFLSEPSAFASNLLGSLSPLEACIEYLILHVPECDLPQRFLPTNNSSNPFITSAYSGNDDLKRRWIQDKAVKEAGWPPNAVKECTADMTTIQSWDLLMVALGKKLIGLQMNDTATDTSPAYPIEEDEYIALGARLENPGHIILPLFSAPIDIHILFSGDAQYPRPGYIPIYITSKTIPAYVRLHLLSVLLLAMEHKSDLEVGEGYFMTVMRIVEEEWVLIEDNGPPDMSTVLRHLLPRPERFVPDPNVIPGTIDSPGPQKQKGRRYARNVLGDAQIRLNLEGVQQTDKYKKMLESRAKLPAFKAKEDFLDKLGKSRVVVVVGETGCGKTTQLPQFILDSLITSNRGSQASIIVTQPRRISAISVAARVSQERIDDGSVGYAIRGESKQDRNTKLLFCTTGVVLRRLSSGDTLEDVSHIVVDEVHERSVDGDFLLLELKELLKHHPTLKVVLMSATINHETFVKYFNGAPLLMIPGFAHPVVDKYLEDIIPIINYRPASVKPTRKENADAQKALRQEYLSSGLDESSVTAIQNITRSERIDYQLIASLVEHIVSTVTTPGGVLIFLPGVGEIRQCIDAIRKGVRNKEAVILPLHANLSNDEQRRVFELTKSWKIIAATNVAETSITIDDVVYVIDAGKVKETQYDPETSLSRLVETWVTRAAARQRRGRAGRTQPGTCYKLYTRKQEVNMAKFPIPEILRVPLESISLAVKATREDQDVKKFLSQAIDPPAVGAMDKAWSILEELGAIDDAGKLTALGKHISMLPVDIRLAKMLILSTIFQCLDPILTVAALLSSKPLFLSPMEKKDEASRARDRFLTGNSDLLTDVKAYNDCVKMHKEGKSQGAVKSFCEENFISSATIREVSSLRQDFVNSLVEIGFIPRDSTPSTPALNRGSDNINLVKGVMVGGLWPRVARVHLPKDRIKFDKVSAGTIQRENTAKEFKMYDLRDGRVFLHPGSVLFGASVWKTPVLFYFHKYMTSKVFLRDASEVPLYGLLLFGGKVTVNHIQGGLTIGHKDSFIRVRAITRIGVLVNQLRRLLDSQLQKCIEEGTTINADSGNPVVNAIMALLRHDGLTE